MHYQTQLSLPIVIKEQLNGFVCENLIEIKMAVTTIHLPDSFDQWVALKLT